VTAFYDTIVIGGGVMGAAAAWALARGNPRGRPRRKVLMIERFTMAHERGSSHGDARILRFTYPEPVYVEMARLSLPLWRELEEESEEALVYETGSFECGAPGSPRLAELATSLEAAGLPFLRLSRSESRRQFPHFELPFGAEALYQSGGAVVHADLAVRALWRAAAAQGAELRQETKVEALEPQGDSVRVVTSAGIFTAQNVVVCAGGWTKRLLAGLDLDLPLEPTREVVAYFPVSPLAGARLVDHRAGAMPTLIDYHEDPPFYALPQLETPGVKVGWHHSGPPADPEEEGLADSHLVRRIQSFVGDRLPYLDLHPLVVKTCLYTNTPDRHFVLDRHPRQDNVTIGAGFSGHGFKFAPMIGEILADLICRHSASLDLSLFEIARFSSGNPLVPRTSA
jgi:monomeric sarcosine oxidase